MKTGIFWQSYTNIVHAAKNYLTQAWSLNVLFLFFASASLAQSQGSLKVEVLDNSQEAIPFANVNVYKESMIQSIVSTDFDGLAIARLDTGSYNVKVTYTGYQTRQVNKVLIVADKVTRLRIQLSVEGTNMQQTIVTEYETPLIDEDTKSVCGISRENFQKMATKNVNSVVQGTGCIYQDYHRGESATINVRDGRGTRVFIDGERVIGTLLIGDPVEAPVELKLGGLSAQFENTKVGAGAIFPNP